MLLRRGSILVFACCLVAAANDSWGGERDAAPISMAPSEGFAGGAFGDAHNLNNSSEYLGCSLAATTGSTTLNAKCWARHTGFSESSCTATATAPITMSDPFFGPLLSLSGDSDIALFWDPSALVCTSLVVDNMSNYSQKNSGGSLAPAAYPAGLTVDTTARVARGALATVRRIANNTTAYLGCKLTGNSAGGLSVHCEAHDTSTNNPVQFCDSTERAMVDVVRTLRGDSYLEFHWTPTGHVCSAITVVTDSRYQPNR